LSDEITGTSVVPEKPLAGEFAIRAWTNTWVPASISSSPGAPGELMPTSLLVRRGRSVAFVLGTGR
jgi:hypothetical protein